MTTPGAAALRSLAELSSDERRTLVDFAVTHGPSSLFADAHELASMEETVLDGGRDLLSVWQADRPVALAGVIVREVPRNGIAYLAGVVGDDPDAFASLADRALGRARDRGAQVLKAGLPARLLDLLPVLEARGFVEVDRALVLQRLATPQPMDPFVAIDPLAQGSMDLWLSIHNRAFAHAPNGSTMDRVELAGRMARPELALGLAFLDGIPFGTWDVRVEGDAHIIESLAVDPGAQGQGLGRELLRALIDRAAAAGTTRVQLDVMRSNARAVALYRAEGFSDLRTKSVWLERAP